MSFIGHHNASKFELLFCFWSINHFLHQPHSLQWCFRKACLSFLVALYSDDCDQKGDITEPEPESDDVVDGYPSINAVSLLGVQSSSYTVRGVTISLPESVPKFVLIEHPDRHWQVMPCNFKRYKDRVKLFICSGVKQGPIGIRTSEDWNLTHWGIQVNGKPDVWLVTSALPCGKVQFKFVAGSDDNLVWEPSPFINREIDFDAESQFVETQWGTMKNTRIVNVPLYKKMATIAVTLPKVSDIDKLVRSTPGHRLMIKGLKDTNNKLIFPKGHQIALSWLDCFEAYCAFISVDGHHIKLRFTVTVVDDNDVVTHVDKHSFVQTGSRYREIDLLNNSTVHCESFEDVLPLKWRSPGAEHTPVDYGNKSLLELINNSSSPDHDHNHNHLMFSMVESHSSETKHSNIMRSLSKSISFRCIQNKFRRQYSNHSQDAEEEYVPKAHKDNIAANVIGGGLASYLNIADHSA